MEKINSIKFENLSVGGECNLFHHGVVQDCIERFTQKFSSGKIYGIIGEFGCGGAALACGISGLTNYYEGKVYINDVEVDFAECVKKSWYIGAGLKMKKGILRHRLTVREQIQYGIQQSGKQISCEVVQKMFEVSDARIDRNIEFLSGERWKASAAVGFANEKLIFCYPWFNSKDIEHLQEQMNKTVQTLLNTGKIVIIPTTKVDNIKKICEEYEIIYL